jgi:hypothetical protein
MEPIEKIKSLGYKVISKVGPNDENAISDLERSQNIKFPADYILLIKQIGYFHFTNSVMSKGTRISNISIDNNLVPVGRFYTWQGNDFSIEKILNMYQEQLPAMFIPFAEGESGDLIGFNFIDENNYKVSYWHHEGAIGNNVHLISQDFKNFIDSLIIHEVVPDSNELAKVKHLGPSPQMIELLKKTGKWKGD